MGKHAKPVQPVASATPTHVEQGTVDTPAAVLGRTHVSSVRPASAKDQDRDLADILGEMDPADWDPVTRDGMGPLSDAGLQTRGPRSACLGTFQLVRKLGVGGFGAVYLARQRETKEEVALKVLARSMAIRPDFLTRFYREARTLSRLEHPNIVRGYEPFEADGWHCFAMEFLDGDSMQTWLRRLGKLGVGDAVHIGLCVASALHYAHDLGLVHRDIKPENILLTRQGLVKVADLGLAKAVDEDLSLTRSGTGFGTPHYMAPEQARNAKHADTRSDIYSLGTTLYHLLTGQLPFKGDTALELILSKEQSPLPEMRKLNPEVTEQLDLVVYKMLAKNANHRYQSAAELIRDLQRLDLASPHLTFLGHLVDPDAYEATPPPSAVTRPVLIAVQSSAPGSTHHPAEHWWNVRNLNSHGKKVTRRMTTRQVQEVLLDPHFDMKAEASPQEGAEYQPLVFYPEFQANLLRRQSLVAKTSAADSSVKLKKLYDEDQDLRTAEAERRRNEQRESARVRDLVRKPNVTGGLATARQLWREHRHSPLGRTIFYLALLAGSSLLLWLAFKFIARP